MCSGWLIHQTSASWASFSPLWTVGRLLISAGRRHAPSTFSCSLESRTTASSASSSPSLRRVAAHDVRLTWGAPSATVYSLPLSDGCSFPVFSTVGRPRCLVGSGHDPSTHSCSLALRTTASSTTSSPSSTTITTSTSSSPPSWRLAAYAAGSVRGLCPLDAQWLAAHRLRFRRCLSCLSPLRDGWSPTTMSSSGRGLSTRSSWLPSSAQGPLRRCPDRLRNGMPRHLSGVGPGPIDTQLLGSFVLDAICAVYKPSTLAWVWGQSHSWQ